ncbi:hypothetical protein GCM10007852_12690 [Agaribacter marinus]|uniref:Uncharacterized protein n=1 Tax=Agaribacter marinus TaxID=1431249 RepID=A0AA37SYW3_9ALTE|nr:hypothetical protein GCM10007852_12690 [Agaribacter marinus]
MLRSKSKYFCITFKGNMFTIGPIKNREKHMKKIAKYLYALTSSRNNVKYININKYRNADVNGNIPRTNTSQETSVIPILYLTSYYLSVMGTTPQ